MIWGYLLVFLVLVSIRFIIYWTKLISIKKYFKLYIEYLKSSSLEFHQHKSQIIQLFKDADLADFSIPILEPAGYGQLRHFMAPGYENMTLTQAEVIPIIQSKFNEAIGVFKHRMLQAINPLFWIEFIFKLPQFLLEFVGVLPDKIIVKIALLVYWLVALIFGLKKFDLIDQLLK